MYGPNPSIPIENAVREPPVKALIKPIKADYTERGVILERNVNGARESQIKTRSYRSLRSLQDDMKRDNSNTVGVRSHIRANVRTSIIACDDVFNRN